MTPQVKQALDDLDRALAALRAALSDELTAPVILPPATGKGLTQQDIEDAAESLGVSDPVIYAVRDVESNGQGFGADGRPIILYEPHIFSRLTEHRFDDTHGGVSYRKWGAKPYPKTQAERWAQMEYAMRLDRDAALQAASYGLFQIMGFNWKVCGFESLNAFVEAMYRSERDHLMAFVGFVKNSHLDDELQALDWLKFAGGYNGPGQAAAYAAKLSKAYAKRSAL